MPAPTIIRVSEYEKLYYDPHKPFQQKHWEALCRYHDRQLHQPSGGPEYFRILNKGIQFTSYVGVVQAGNLTIEILPKTDRDATTAANETVVVMQEQHQEEAMQKSQWQAVLIQMLKECRLLQVHAADYANLQLRSHFILDIYLEIFLNEVEQLLQKGLLKQYEKKEGNHTALKGQLLFQKQATLNALHAERFYIRYTAYEYHNVFNRILYEALQLITGLNVRSSLLDQAARLLLYFPALSIIRPTTETFQQLHYDRKTEVYRPAMLIAEMLLLNHSPDVTGGTENVLAILFDMNLLWEEWVYRQVKKEAANRKVTVLRQPTENFWKGEHLQRHKTIRPDMVIQSENKTVIVDTKWKLLENNTPSDADLKQLFVYHLYWKSNESILLYPANEISKPLSGTYAQLPYRDGEMGRCRIVTQPVLEHGKLDAAFGKKLLDIAMGMHPGSD